MSKYLCATFLDTYCKTSKFQPDSLLFIQAPRLGYKELTEKHQLKVSLEVLAMGRYGPLFRIWDLRLTQFTAVL